MSKATKEPDLVGLLSALKSAVPKVKEYTQDNRKELKAFITVVQKLVREIDHIPSKLVSNMANVYTSGPGGATGVLQALTPSRLFVVPAPGSIPLSQLAVQAVFSHHICGGFGSKNPDVNQSIIRKHHIGLRPRIKVVRDSVMRTIISTFGSSSGAQQYQPDSGVDRRQIAECMWMNPVLDPIYATRISGQAKLLAPADTQRSNGGVPVLREEDEISVYVMGSKLLRALVKHVRDVGIINNDVVANLLPKEGSAPRKVDYRVKRASAFGQLLLLAQAEFEARKQNRPNRNIRVNDAASSDIMTIGRDGLIETSSTQLSRLVSFLTHPDTPVTSLLKKAVSYQDKKSKDVPAVAHSIYRAAAMSRLAVLIMNHAKQTYR